MLEEKSEHEEDGDRAKEGFYKASRAGDSLSNTRSTKQILPPIQQSGHGGLMSSQNQMKSTAQISLKRQNSDLTLTTKYNSQSNPNIKLTKYSQRNPVDS